MFDDTTQRDAKLPKKWDAWEEFGLTHDIVRAFHHSFGEYLLELRPCQHSDRHNPRFGWLELRLCTLTIREG